MELNVATSVAGLACRLQATSLYLFVDLHNDPPTLRWHRI